jgi:hypothetical protein
MDFAPSYTISLNKLPSRSKMDHRDAAQATNSTVSRNRPVSGRQGAKRELNLRDQVGIELEAAIALPAEPQLCRRLPEYARIWK